MYIYVLSHYCVFAPHQESFVYWA